jgi:hypothetical protein
MRGLLHAGRRRRHALDEIQSLMRSGAAVIASLNAIVIVSCGSHSSDSPVVTASSSGGTTGAAASGGASYVTGAVSGNTSGIPNSTDGGSNNAGTSQLTLDLSYWDPKCGPIDAGPNAVCNVCLLDNCGAVWNEAFGDNWQSGMGSGPCSPLLQCVRVCSCGDSTCYVACTLPVLEDAGDECSAINRSAPNCGAVCKASCP